MLCWRRSRCNPAQHRLFVIMSLIGSTAALLVEGLVVGADPGVADDRHEQTRRRTTELRCRRDVARFTYRGCPTC